MEQEFSIEKQDFTIIKEKIIKTHELLELYNEKNDKLARATHAFKQLKSKYETSVHEVNQLKIDNERLNYSLETLRPKYEQNEKELIEVRSDYSRVEEKYQQTMIESQLMISDLENKIKTCTCEKDLCLSPSKSRNPKEKVKELKEICKKNKEIETRLKNENRDLVQKYKELQEEKSNNLKVIQDLGLKNGTLQKDLALVKTKLQKMELEFREQANHQNTIASLNQNHISEVKSLKKQIAKLTFDNQRIEYLELECKNLKEQINNTKMVTSQKSDCSVQTENISKDDNFSKEESTKKIEMLEQECKELKEKLNHFKKISVSEQNFRSNVQIGKSTQTECEDSLSDFNDIVSDILGEMILPMALSPLRFSPILADCPTLPVLGGFEPLEPFDEEMSQDTSYENTIPNIIITPPTPSIGKSNPMKVMFPLLTERLVEEMPQNEQIEEMVVVNKDPTNSQASEKSLIENVISTVKIKPPDLQNQVLQQNENLEKENLQKENIHKMEVPNADTINIQNNSDFTSDIFVATCEKSVSTEDNIGSLNANCVPVTENLKSSKLNLQEDLGNFKERLKRRRKFWIPYNMNQLVKVKNKKQKKVARVSKEYKDNVLKKPVQNDTILDALRTLQQNNINFTISNESIPLVQPYSSSSLSTLPKIELGLTSKKFKDTYSLELGCWNKNCTKSNTQMLLRKVENDEEPELLGFFSVKDKIIPPAISRKVEQKQPKLLDTQDLLEQLLTGIKELVEVKRKESSGNRKKKRSKLKNRPLDFYSETETELEKLFRKSADVLERNRRFLAEAKDQSFDSNEESVFDSDMMVDSGLVTGTPNTDSLSFCSRTELGDGVSMNILSPSIEGNRNIVEDNRILVNLNEENLASLTNDEILAEYSLPGSAVFKTVNTFKNDRSSILNNYTTPKFSSCPVMLSPIASSKGSPEGLQIPSTILKTPEFNSSSQTSPECFKLPHCPIMISPMASSKGSPVTRTSGSANIKDISEDSLDSFRRPCISNESDYTDIISLFPVRENSAFSYLSEASKSKTEVSRPNTSNFLSLNEQDISHVISSDKNMDPIKNCQDTKSSFSGSASSLLYQKITFDSIENNQSLHQRVAGLNNDTLQKSVENVKNHSSFCSTSLASENNVICFDKAFSSESDNLIQTQVKLNSSENSNGSTLQVDLSLKSSDLNCSLNDISISQLDVSSEIDKKINEVTTHRNDFIKNNCLEAEETTYCLREKSQNKYKSNVTTRYSLRRKSQSSSVTNDNFEQETQAPLVVNNVDTKSSRTRASKRKLDEQVINKAKHEESCNIDVSKLPEKIELAEPVKRKRGRPRKIAVSVTSENKDMNNCEVLSKSSENQSYIESKVKDDNPCKNSGIADTVENIRMPEQAELKNQQKTDRNSTNDAEEGTLNFGRKGEGELYKNDVGKKSQRRRNSVNSKKITSKEFISESESDYDNFAIAVPHIISKNSYMLEDMVPDDKNQKNTKTNSIFTEEGIFNKPVLNSKNPLPSKESTYHQSLCAGERDFSGSNQILKQNVLTDAQEKNENNDIVSESASEESSCIKSNTNSTIQTITSEIQSILRGLTEESSLKNSLNGINRNTAVSEKDLFGDVSDLEEESSICSNKDLKVPQKQVLKRKVAGGSNLKKRIFSQVRDTVYVYSENKGCDSIKKSCSNKEVDRPREQVQENRLGDLAPNVTDTRKINIVQDILITKGQTFTLLSKTEKNAQTVSSAPSTLKVNKIGFPITYSRKRAKLQQQISNSTPVDILSQVMQGMIQTGPKALARKKGFIQPSNSVPIQQPVTPASDFRTEFKPENMQPIGKSSQMVTKVGEERVAETENIIDSYLDCPRSPDVLELPDRLPRLIPTEKPDRLQGSKVRTLIDKLMVFSNEAKMVDDVVKEFAFQDIDYMAEIIVDKVSEDYHDKADTLFPPSPPMTCTQRILLGFLMKLDRSTHPGILDKFLSVAELTLFNKPKCRLEIVQPITRLYTAVCKVRYDLNRIRRFICEGFYFMADFAIPLFFTILTMWPNVIPVESESSNNLLAKIIVQLCYLKSCNKPGYNLLPLRDILNKYFGYPSGGWNCEDIFQEIFVEYIRNPSIRLSDYTLLLFLKNKPTNWVYKKIKNCIIPLYKKTSDTNSNLKATLVILLANICRGFEKYVEYDWKVLTEMDEWFMQLDNDDLDPIIKRAIHLARGRLPRRPRVRKHNKVTPKINSDSNKSDNKDDLNITESSERTQNCLNEDSMLSDRQEECEDSNKIKNEDTTRSLKDEYSESTKNNVNIEFKLDDSSKTHYDDSLSLELSDIEF